jgi:hypothetical protein
MVGWRKPDQSPDSEKVSYERISAGTHKPHKLRLNQLQVPTNVQLSLHGVSTFTLWVHPQLAVVMNHKVKVPRIDFQSVMTTVTS